VLLGSQHKRTLAIGLQFARAAVRSGANSAAR
jgi:hypothetical protein